MFRAERDGRGFNIIYHQTRADQSVYFKLTSHYLTTIKLSLNKEGLCMPQGLNSEQGVIKDVYISLGVLYHQYTI